MTETITMWDGTTVTRPLEPAEAFAARVLDLTGVELDAMPDLPLDARIVPGPTVARRGATYVYAIADGEADVLGYVVSGRTADLRGPLYGPSLPPPDALASLRRAVARHPDGSHMCRALSAVVDAAERDCAEACDPDAHPDQMVSAERAAADAAALVARDSGHLRARRQRRGWGVSA